MISQRAELERGKCTGINEVVRKPPRQQRIGADKEAGVALRFQNLPVSAAIQKASRARTAREFQPNG